jgi:CheY-specific phosphatase CheX
MQIMAGISMSEVKITDYKDIHITDACVSGVYFMNGPKNAILIVSMATAAAFTMVSRFSGIPVSELGADTICDAINELTNMISGKIKAQLTPLGYEYINSHCFSVYGSQYLILHKGKLKNITKKYKAENTELVLRILFV